MRITQTTPTAAITIPVDHLSADERIALMARLWDSLDPATAAPVTEALAAELDRRVAEADIDPAAGEPWSAIRSALRVHRSVDTL